MPTKKITKKPSAKKANTVVENQPPAKTHLCNWGHDASPIGKQPFACGNPILSIDNPPEGRQEDTDGIYWMNTESKKMWFNLNGTWTHYNTNPI